MRHYRATVEYDGTDFAGFQLQLNQRTVQGDLEEALLKLTKNMVRVHGAGRTDSGVHSVGQVISFKADTRIPVERISFAMNSVLKPDVRVLSAEETDERFHARFSAVSRTYVYLILNRPEPTALWRRYALHFASPLDIGLMREVTNSILGTHDFSSWANSIKEANGTVRTVRQFHIRRVREFVLIHIEANGFLHGMVRNLVGALLEVGAGKRAPEDIERITACKDRRCAGLCAPAHGLCLVKVKY
jgi:tRNA pseudouridine38-40 synthase